MDENEQQDQPESQAESQPGTQNEQEANPSKTGERKPMNWQERLLPLMGGMLTALAAFFFLVTFVQMSYLHWSIFRSPPIQMETASQEALYVSTNNFADLYEARQFEVRAAMERYIIEKRYHQISVLQMSGLWLRYLGFITGMILSLVGASFILGKLREPEQALEGKFSEVASLSLRTTSPGIILAVLGVVLIFATLVDKDVYDVKDANVYLSVLAPLTAPTPGAGDALQSLPDYLDTGTQPGPTQPAPEPSITSNDDGSSPSSGLPPRPGGDP